MEKSARNLSCLKWGLLLSLLTLLYGFGLGGTFGAFEDDLKDHLKAQAQRVRDEQYGGDEAKIKKVAAKSWVYFKRAHLHANGLGTASLALILLLSLIPGRERLRALSAIALGLGSLGYSMFWMFAALKAPGLGGTGAAKESLKWLAVPTSGLCILGLLATLGLFVHFAFIQKERQGKEN